MVCNIAKELRFVGVISRIFLYFSVLSLASFPFLELFQFTLIKSDAFAGEQQKEDALSADSSITDSPEFRLNGFIEFENFFSTYDEHSFKDANVKNELRNKIQLRYGSTYCYFFSKVNFYVDSSLIDDGVAKEYFYSNKNNTTRNGKMSSQNVEINLNEFYLNYGRNNFRLRVGNQIYLWGTTDLKNPTSYFNPMDMRELMFKWEDEFALGIPSFSGMMFLDDYTFELVFAPVHVTPILPLDNSYWAVDFGKNLVDISIKESEALDIKPENFGIGARLSTIGNGKDFSISGYHGPDKEAVVVPEGTVTPVPDGDFLLTVQPEYHVVNAVGFDFSKTLNKMVVQFETAYYFDKYGVVEQDLTDTETVYFPFKTKKSPFISISAGFNYFVPLEKVLKGHDGMAVFTMGMALSRYMEDDIVPSFLDNLLIVRLDDTYFENRVTISLSGLYEFENKGVVFWPTVSYDFQNGFTLHLSYADISGKDTSDYDMGNLLYNYRTKDVIMVRLRYYY